MSDGTIDELLGLDIICEVCECNPINMKVKIIRAARGLKCVCCDCAERLELCHLLTVVDSKIKF